MGYEGLSKLFYKSPEQYQAAYQRRFAGDATVHFAFDVHQKPAFLVITPELLSLIDQIHVLDKQLTWISRRLPKIAKQQYSTWAVIEEIRLTNEIEGVHSTRREIQLLVEDHLPVKNEQRLVGFVKKYRQLMNRQSIPLRTCEDLRRLYDELCLPDVIADAADHAPDGLLFRKDSVSIYSESQKEIHKGLYPESAILSAMTKALDMLRDSQLPVLLRIALFHYCFAYIHPFYDGNGRMDRFISSYYLAWNFNPLLGYHLSYTIKKELSTYYKLFKQTNDPRNCGDLTLFAEGFLRIIRTSSESLNASLLKRLEKMTFFRNQLLKRFPNDRHFRVLHILMLNTLFGYRGLTLPELAAACGMDEPLTAVLLQTLATQTPLVVLYREGEHTMYEVNLERLAEIP